MGSVCKLHPTVRQQLHLLLRPGLSEWVNVSLLIVEGTNDVVADDLQQEKWEDATRNGVRTKKHMSSN